MHFDAHLASRAASSFVTAAVVVLAVTACGDSPTAVRSEAAVAPRPSADAAIAEASPSSAAIIVSPDQAVTVDLGEGLHVPGRFHSTLVILPGGEVRGMARLVYEVPDAEGDPVGGTINYSYDAVGNRAPGEAVSFEGLAELCESPGGECRTLPITGTIQQGTTADCLIYDIFGPDVHPDPPTKLFSFEAISKVIVPSEKPQ